MGTPATLPADFFNKQQVPDTLPADFFSQKSAITPDTLQSFIVRRSQGQLSPEETQQLDAFIGDPVNRLAVEAAKAAGQTDYTKEVGPVSRFLMPAADVVAGTVELGKRAFDPKVSPAEFLAGPALPLVRAVRDVGGGLIQAQREAGQEYLEKAAREQNPLQNVQRFLEAGVPLAGPAYRSLRKKVESGDVAGALGEAGLNILGARGVTKPPVPGARASVVSRAVGTSVREKIPELAMRDVIGPHLADFKFGRNPVKAVVEEGLSAATDRGLLDKIRARKSDVGKRIEMQLSLKGAAGKAVDVKQAVDDALHEHLRRARQLGDDAVIKRIVKFRNAVTRRPNLNPREAAKLKRDIGESVHWTEDPIESSLNAAKQDVYSRINDAIDRQVPGTKELNARYADLLHAEKSMKRVVDKGRGLKGWLRVGAAVGGGTAATGNPLVGGALALADTTAGRSTIARTLGRRSSPQVTPVPPQATGSKAGQLLKDADGFVWSWGGKDWKLFSRPRP